MKKLHKKLREVAEYIDLSNANQTRQLKNLAVACQDYELASELRQLEIAAEKTLAEGCRFSKEIERSISSQVLSRNEWSVVEPKQQIQALTDLAKKLEDEEPVLLYNAIMTPDGTLLVSRSTHDYVSHFDTKVNQTYSLDGGLSYIRLSTPGNYVNCAVYSNDPFEKIRESLERIHRGKNGDQPMKYVVLKDMSDEWLNSLIPWIEENQPSNPLKKYYIKELEYRELNNITVKEDE